MTRTRLLLAVVAAAAIGLVVALIFGRDDEAGDPAAAAPPPQRLAAGPAATIEPGLGGDLQASVLQVDDDPAGELRLEGQVIDRDEHPVGGAIVAIDSNPPREVVTESDGSFAFDQLVGRTYKVEARAGDSIAGPAAVQLTPTAEPVVLRLRETGRLVVDVRSAADDTPIANALVELRGLSARVASTDATGRAILTGVGGGWHVVRASAPGHASEYTEIATVDEPGRERTLAFRLRPGAGASGTVVDASGAPVEGARVFAEVASRFDLSDPRLDGAVSDAKGRWRLAGLPRETVRFHAFHTAYAPAATAPLPLGDGTDHDDVTIVLEPGASLAGRVVTRDGAPVPGAEVRLTGADARSSQVRRVRADGEGRFTLAGLPRRVVHLMAADHGITSEVARVDLGRAAPASLELVLGLDATIAGVVVTSSGEPVAEARVVAVAVSRDDPDERVTARLRGRPSTVADGDGGFRLGGLAPGEYLIRAIRPGDAPELVTMRAGVRVATGTTGAEIVVDDLTTLVGKVAFRDGRHPALFTVALGWAAPRSFASPDGAFRIEGVPTGRQYLVVAGPEIVTEGRADVEIIAGEVHDLGTVVVERGRTITGTVVDDGGAPVRGALVVIGRELRGDGLSLVRAGEEPLRQAVTGADGRFTLRGLGPGVHVLAADHDAVGRSPAFDVAAGTEDLDVRLALRVPGAVQGFVRRAAGFEDVFVQLRPFDAANAQWTLAAGPDGSFRFDRIAPGRYLVWAGVERGTRLGGSDGAGKRGEVRSGEVLEVDVDLDPGTISVGLRLAGEVAEYGYGVIVRDANGALRDARPRNVDEARRLLLATDTVDVREGMIVDNRRIQFDQVKPGDYLACIAPLRGDPDDPSVVAEMQQQIVDWPIECENASVAATPATQEITVTVRTAPP
jgi:protocatechuate 3,4-dioxygenase beta subunit